MISNSAWRSERSGSSGSNVTATDAHVLGRTQQRPEERRPHLSPRPATDLERRVHCAVRAVVAPVRAGRGGPGRRFGQLIAAASRPQRRELRADVGVKGQPQHARQPAWRRRGVDLHARAFERLGDPFGGGDQPLLARAAAIVADQRRVDLHREYHLVLASGLGA